MVRGLYTAYTGMRNEQRRLDIISNNLANSATIGYKEENVTSRSFKDMMAVKIRDGSVGMAACTAAVVLLFARPQAPLPPAVACSARQVPCARHPCRP